MGVAVILMGDVDNNGDDHVLTLRFVPRTIIYWKLRRAFPLFFFLVSLVNSSVKTAIFFFNFYSGVHGGLPRKLQMC